nr:amblin-like isoform X1 [Dermacentor andersoni]
MKHLSSHLTLLVCVVHAHAGFNCFKNCKREKPVPHPTPSICLKTPVLGRCKPLLNNWYFDHYFKECVKVNPTLCGTGNNLFGTLERCKKVCERAVGPAQICLTPPRFASARPLLQHWYFSVECACCKRLNYTLGSASRNRFSSELKCQEVCIPNRNPTAVCSLTPVSEGCLRFKKRLKQWYFNATRNTCRRFSNGGCAHNRNGFTSFNMCMARCSCFKPEETLDETQAEHTELE